MTVFREKPFDEPRFQIGHDRAPAGTALRTRPLCMSLGSVTWVCIRL
jgi:hypothetical protein